MPGIEVKTSEEGSRPDDTFDCGVDLGEQATDPVGDTGGFASEVVVETYQDSQFGEGLVAGIYPAVWGVAQIWTGHWSDRIGRKPPIVGGMLLQAAALVVLALSDGAVGVAAIAAGFLGLGTALTIAVPILWHL